MLASARMFPAKLVLVPSVAELPTCQNAPQDWPPLMKTTRPARGGERAPDLEDPDRAGVAQAVQGERSRELGRAREAVGARRERQPAEVDAGQVDVAGLAGERVVGGDDRGLGIERDRISHVYRSGTIPGARGEPVIEAAPSGLIPSSPARTVKPVLVTAEAARTAKGSAAPRGGATAMAETRPSSPVAAVWGPVGVRSGRLGAASRVAKARVAIRSGVARRRTGVMAGLSIPGLPAARRGTSIYIIRTAGTYRVRQSDSVQF